MSEIPSHAQQLLDELRQICSQYSREVPGKRRPWPKSIRDRVIVLRRIGVSFERIAKATGIPLHTMYSWRIGKQTISAFLPIRVKDKQAVVPYQPSRLEKRKFKSEVRPVRGQPSTVTVVLANGLRLEGLDFSQAMEAARGLK